MSAPPPPTGPPAGWYTDPVDGVGYRWWDGSAWTDAVSGPEPQGSSEHGNGHVAVLTERPEDPVGSIEGLLSDTIRLATSRFGHLLPVIVMFLLALGLASSIALWFGLQDTVITFDEAAAEPPAIDYGGSAAALWIYLALVPLSLLGGAVLQATTARQVWAAQAEKPETWTASLAGVARRWRPLLGGTVVKWLAYSAIGGGFVVATLFVPVIAITFPIVVIALALVWLRLSFVGQAAVLAPAGSSAVSTSYRVTGTAAGKLFVRLLVLALIGFATLLVITLVGSFFTAIAGAEGTTPLDPDDLTYDLNAALGPNVALFALSGVFGSLAIGGATVLVATGTTLLYRDLRGPIAPDLDAADEPEAADIAAATDQANDGPMLG